MVRKPQRFTLPRFRILPLFILAGALMFGVRVGSLWQGLFGGAARTPAVERPFIPPALAQSGEPAKAPASAPGSGGERTAFSQSEIEVLQHLAERREELDRRERELDQRLAVMSAAETQIEAKIKKLREIQSTIEGLIEKHDEQEDQKIESLVKIYQAMKPKDAARIFEQMDMSILIRVFRQMKERTAAAILAEMTSERANAVTQELAIATRLPPGLTGETGVKR